MRGGLRTHACADMAMPLWGERRGGHAQVRRARRTKARDKSCIMGLPVGCACLRRVDLRPFLAPSKLRHGWESHGVPASVTAISIKLNELTKNPYLPTNHNQPLTYLPITPHTSPYHLPSHYLTPFNILHSDSTSAKHHQRKKNYIKLLWVVRMPEPPK